MWRGIRRIGGGLALCMLAAGVAWAQVDFTRFYTIGDSLTAGFSHGSLVVTFQQYSYPALIAQQAGVTDFEQPLISEPGIPPRLVLKSLFPTTVIEPLPGLGKPINLTLPRPYNNLAVPGATVTDVLETVTGDLHDAILRGLGTQFQQLLASSPTFIIVWIGNVDALGAVTSGRVIPGVTLTPVSTFVDRIRTIFNGIALATDAQVLVLNLPDATRTPFATTIPPVVINPQTRQPVLDQNGNPIPLIGPTGPLPSDALVLLTASPLLAQGTGIPVELGGNGQPLPDEVVLLPGEVQQIRSQIQAYNQQIAAAAQDAGFKVFDFATLFDELAETGYHVGGIDLSFDFLIGGLFSLDGIHPTPLGYAILANYIIQYMNENMGTELDFIDLLPFVTGEKGGIPMEGTVGTGAFRFHPHAVENLLRVTAGKYLEFKRQHEKKIRQQ